MRSVIELNLGLQTIDLSRRAGIARRRVDDVIAGLEAVDAIDAAIVRLPAAGGLQRALPALQDVAKRPDRGTRDRLTVLVEDRARDHAAAPDLQLHLQALTIGKLNRRAGRPGRR